MGPGKGHISCRNLLESSWNLEGLKWSRRLSLFPNDEDTAAQSRLWDLFMSKGSGNKHPEGSEFSLTPARGLALQAFLLLSKAISAWPEGWQGPIFVLLLCPCLKHK